jgi:hypothetical protein
MNEYKICQVNEMWTKKLKIYIYRAFVGLDSKLYMMYGTYFKMYNFHMLDFKYGEYLRQYEEECSGCVL